MADSFDKIDCVKLYAGRIKFYANAIVELHEFGHETGLDEEPWGPAYQRKAVKVYLDVLPTAYLQQLAAEFLGCSATMAEQPDPPAGLAEHWRIVDAYFRNGAEAICDALDITVQPRWEDPTGKEPITPAGVAFATLAPYITAQSAIRLREAGSDVAEHVHSRRPLNVIQIKILCDLASGASMFEVGERHGFSERSLFREIKEIRRILKVKTKQEAITHAAQCGWI